MNRVQLLSPIGKFGLVSVLCLMLHGCTPGGSSPVSRKKMPELSGDNNFEGPMPFQSSVSTMLGSDAYAFQTSNTQIEVDGTLRDFIYVPLPDASNDSLAIALLDSYKTMAVPMLSSWAARQQQGVAIDLNTHRGAATHRSDFVLEKPGVFSIPVVIIWDPASAARMETIKSIAGALSGVSFRTIAR